MTTPALDIEAYIKNVVVPLLDFPERATISVTDSGGRNIKNIEVFQIGRAHV